MSGRIVAGQFHHSVDLEERPEWPEAKWVARFTAPGVDECGYFYLKQQAMDWVTAQVAKFQGGRTVMPAPDGDGVVVLPHSFGGRSTHMGPALAVRVRDASPLMGDLEVAANIAERLVIAERLLREVAELATAPSLSDFARMAYAACGKVVTLREWSACEALEEKAVHLNLADVDDPVEPVRHLSVVPDGGAA